MLVKRHLFLFAFLLIACSQEDDTNIEINTLATAIEGREGVMGNVIACAASNEDSSVVSIFLYPREGVTNVNFYETAIAEVDDTDFSLYTRGEAPLIDVFNGYLLKYEVSQVAEKWIIVSFEEDGQIHLSNPIRLRHLSKPTEYLPQNVEIDLTMSTMPVFKWQDGSFTDNAIYFHVVSDVNGDLLSGTYTLDKFFQYYKLENVVLNITEVEPPVNLHADANYDFTLLAVSEDNWVNLFSTRTFIVN